MAQGTGAAISARLAAAQEQLQQRRRQRRQERVSQQLPVFTDAHGRLTSPSPSTIEENPPFEADGSRLALSGRCAPAGSIGWESEALTRTLRQAEQRRQAAASCCVSTKLDWLHPSKGGPEATETASRTTAVDQTEAPLPPDVVVHPDIAIAMLREDLAAVGRIWFLLRHLDRQGQGWIEVSTLRKRLTDKDSPLHVCGWRQMRNLLAQGEGLFWQRDDLRASEARLWLRSTARVAEALDVPRLDARPVSLDVSVLLESIGTVRAHFYASYHSGRRNSRPISRKCLEELTGVSRRSQHSYEAETGIESRSNWAVGPEYTQETAQEQAWQQGSGVFQLTDHQGKTGAAGATYVAWQLPNSYVGPHEQQATASRKRINRQLVDLFTKGITGNGKEKVETQSDPYPAPRFYEHGKAAARAYNRSPQNDLYWQSHTTFQQHRVWHILPGHESAS